MAKHATILTLASMFWGLPALAQTEIGPGDDLEAALNALQAGDELVLQGGMYLLEGRTGVTLMGTASEPIVVRAKDGERPHIRREAADQNIVDIDAAEHATLRGLELSGGSAGIRISAASFLTIEECEIHDTGDVALRANDTGVVYESLRILRNHIHHTNNTGEGMYLGCNDNGCQFANGLIEGNYVHHTNQDTVDQGDGIELKEGSYNNVVRDNVIHDTNYPCILTYSTAGNGPPNVIERNLLYRCGDHAIQSAADAVIRNNVILSAGSDGIAMQPHQSGAPANLVVVHNTVLDADGSALSVRGATGSVLVANNALFTDGATALLVSGATDQVTVSGNVVQGSSQSSGGTTSSDLAGAFVAASFGGEPPNDVFPRPAGSLVGAGDTAHVVDDDFNGTPRDGAADVGAYLFDADGNPGWPLAPAPKSSMPSAPTGSGGMGGEAGIGAGNVGGAGGGAGTGPQAGAGGSGAGGAGGESGEGGHGAAGEASGEGAGSDDSGCGCRTAGRRSAGNAALVCLLAMVVLLARRRAHCVMSSTKRSSA